MTHRLSCDREVDQVIFDTGNEIRRKAQEAVRHYSDYCQKVPRYRELLAEMALVEEPEELDEPE